MGLLPAQYTPTASDSEWNTWNFVPVAMSYVSWWVFFFQGRRWVWADTYPIGMVPESLCTSQSLVTLTKVLGAQNNPTSGIIAEAVTRWQISSCSIVDVDMLLGDVYAEGPGNLFIFFTPWIVRGHLLWWASRPMVCGARPTDACSTWRLMAGSGTRYI